MGLINRGEDLPRPEPKGFEDIMELVKKVLGRTAFQILMAEENCYKAGGCVRVLLVVPGCPLDKPYVVGLQDTY